MARHYRINGETHTFRRLPAWRRLLRALLALFLAGGASGATWNTPPADHTTATSPSSCRLSDGSAFYKGTTPSDTQPVSLLSLPLASNACIETGGNLATIAGKDFATQTTLSGVKTGTDRIPAQGQALAAASLPVVLTAAQIVTLTPPAAITGFALETGGNLATIVTNTNKIPTSPATDRTTAAAPFSFRLSDGSAFYAGATETTASGIKTGTDKIPAQGQALAAASLPVVLTAAQMTTLTPIAGNLEATQLLVKAKTDNIDVLLSTRLKPADTLTGVTTVGAVTAITNALPAGTNRLGSVRLVDSADADLTSAKGTQTSRAVGTQELKNAARTQLSWTANAILSTATAEGLFTLSRSNDMAAGVNSNFYTITSGKRLALQQVSVNLEPAGTSPRYSRLRFRIRGAAAGSCSASSPLQELVVAVSSTGITQGLRSYPDGYEIAGVGDGTRQICFTVETPDWVTTTNAPLIDIDINGYEY